MPGGDGTGPRGMGPMRGRGAGCGESRRSRSVCRRRRDEGQRSGTGRGSCLPPMRNKSAPRARHPLLPAEMPEMRKRDGKGVGRGEHENSSGERKRRDGQDDRGGEPGIFSRQRRSEGAIPRLRRGRAQWAYLSQAGNRADKARLGQSARSGSRQMHLLRRMFERSASFTRWSSFPEAPSSSPNSAMAAASAPSSAPRRQSRRPIAKQDG